MKDKILKSVIVFLMALIFITLAVINNGENNFTNSAEIFKIATENFLDIYTIDGGSFFLCTRDSIKFINENGQEKWLTNAIFSAPIICHSKKILGMSDLKTNIIYIYNETGQLYSAKPDGNLLAFSVNSSGFCCAISKENDLYKINLYDESGKKFLTYVHSEENIFPVNSNVSPDGKILAISYIDANNINIDSKITFMYTNQNDIFASVHEKNNFVYGLNFLSTNDIILTSKKQIVCEKILPNNLKEQWRINFDAEISTLDFNNDFLAIKFDNKNSLYAHDKNLIKFFNMSGKQTGEFKSSEQLDFINVGYDFNYTLTASKNNFIAIDAKGKIIWKYSIAGEYKSAVFLGKPNKILIAIPSKIFALNIKKNGG